MDPSQCANPGLARALRCGLACGVALLALNVSVSWFHLCDAGSAAIQYGVGAGVPVVCAAIVVRVRKHYLLALAAVVVLVLLTYLCRDPYLAWIHGPHSPWPAHEP